MPTLSFRCLLVIAICVSLVFPVQLVAGVIVTIDESTSGAGPNSHRMENSINIPDSTFLFASQYDTAEVNLRAGSPEFGDTVRAYLQAGVSYTASVGSYLDETNTRIFAGTPLDDSVLTMVAADPALGTSGLAAAASGTSFDFLLNGYNVVATNDDSIPNTSGGAGFMSELSFTVDTSGYFYFYTSQWNGGTDSFSNDIAAGFQDNGLGAAVDPHGSFQTSNGAFGTPNGMVTGGTNDPPIAAGTIYTNFYIRQDSVGVDPPPVAGVPEPTSLAIFGFLAAGLVGIRRRASKKVNG